MHTRHLAGLLIALWLLSGCAVPPASMPPYMVMLTPTWPTLEGRCTGAVVDAKTILTAAHCVNHVSRVVTIYGQEAAIVDAKVSPSHDVALLYTAVPLWVGTFAELANAEVGASAVLWGTCPYFMPHQGRRAMYNGLVDVSLKDGGTLTFGQWFMLPAMGDVRGKACGGDSGGILSQGGKVVGVTSAVASDYIFIAIGSVVFTVPVEHVWELLEVEE